MNEWTNKKPRKSYSNPLLRKHGFLKFYKTNIRKKRIENEKKRPIARWIEYREVHTIAYELAHISQTISLLGGCI